VAKVRVPQDRHKIFRLATVSPRRKVSVKKIVSLFGILSILASTSSVFAQMPIAVPMAAPVNLEKIGVVAAAKGKVELTTPGQVGRIASSGQAIFMGDEVKTDSKGHLQILLLDQTVFTIGPSSAIVIDEFVYDPKTEDGKIQASITKGFFRYVSGKIAAKKPDNVSVKLPTATLGFRGTIVAGNVNQDGSSRAALLGPGANNNAGARIGSFIMSGTGSNAGDSQEVNRAGFGVDAGVDGNISGVFQLSDADINNLTAGLSPSDEGGNGGDDESGGDAGGPGGGSDEGGGDPGQDDGPATGDPAPSDMGDDAGAPDQGDADPTGGDSGTNLWEGSATDLSGEGMAAAIENAGDMISFTDFADAVDDTTEQAAQDALDTAGESNPAQPNITTTQLDDPVFVGRTNVFHYQHFFGDFLYTQGGDVYSGTMRASIDMDFLDPANSGTLGGQHSVNPASYVEIDVPGASLQDRFDLAAQNFPGGPGPAELLWTGTGVNGGSFDVLVELQNVEPVEGVVKTAEQAKITTVYASGNDSGGGDMIAPIAPGATDTPPVVQGPG
jgi:hypothetical protein